MGVIRVLLALSVLFDHSSAFPPTGNTFVGGRIAVESFFMVSGFYMALVLEGKYSKSGAIGDFYHNRLLRIFPTYFLVVVGVWILHRALGAPGVIGHILSQDWPWYAKAWMLASNFTMIGSDWMMFFYPTAHGIHFTPNFRLPAQAFYAFHMDPVAWSLPLELMFYGMAPWVVKKPLGLVLLAVGSLYVRVLCYQAFGDNDPWTYRFFPSELLFFCAGALAFHAWFRLKGL
ncbi:MAG TPA: acyltransferase family protein, partial [bacterium]|nr:acyltransferase family protein [bacterium]